jgi:hypothetical protein
MALALVVYLVVRGGLFSAEATAAAVSTIGVAALGAVVGLVSRRATSQLQRAFHRLFAAPAGTGSRPTGSTPSHGEPGAAVAG